MAEKKKTCFIIMPISTPEPFLDKYRDGEEHFRHVLECLLVPSVEMAGYKAISPIAKGSDLIHAEIIHNLELSDLVLCDMSCLNPNVFFEFGIRTSLNKPVCVVKDELTKKVPFDTAILHYQEYKGSLEPWELSGEIKKLAEHIKTAEERSKGENMLWKYFGLRTKAKPYAGETGTEAKIDYLTMQIDSLRQQLSLITERSELQVAKLKRQDIMDNVFDDVLKLLPDDVELVTFGLEPDGYWLVEYRGPFSRQNQHLLSNRIFKKYNILVHFKRWVSEAKKPKTHNKVLKATVDSAP